MMRNIDDLINLYKELAPEPVDSELGEQGTDTQSSTGSAAPASYPTVTKWETGIKRGSANQIGNTKWKDSYPTTRGKANTLL